MTLGALLDAGVDEQKFLQELDKLHVEGYHIKIEETDKNGIRAKHVNVCVDGVPEESGDIHLNGHEHGKASGHEHTHTHDHAHPHRNFADIRRMIEQSALEENVRELALRIFGRVAAAEAKVHGKSIDEVHFHEVGAVDSIIDIVGCAILINMIKPDKICASVLHEGHGFVRCQHGLLSVPVPATSEILAAAGAPLAQIDIEGESYHADGGGDYHGAGGALWRHAGDADYPDGVGSRHEKSAGSQRAAGLSGHCNRSGRSRNGQSARKYRRGWSGGKESRAGREHGLCAG